jgi:hypothetical protein
VLVGNLVVEWSENLSAFELVVGNLVVEWSENLSAFELVVGKNSAFVSLALDATGFETGLSAVVDDVSAFDYLSAESHFCSQKCRKCPTEISFHAYIGHHPKKRYVRHYSLVGDYYFFLLLHRENF